MEAAIVIPAFNEARSIADVVASVSGFGTVIVVDDGSADDTAVRAAEAGATVVSHGVNKGYDAAIESGFSKADEMNADVAVTFDADGQLEAAAIPAALKALANGDAALVLGVRDRGGARLSETLFNFYTRLRFGVPDILCGLKGVRLAASEAHRVRIGTGSVNTALALALLREGATFILVPVAVVPREGKPRYGGVLAANLKIFRAFAAALIDDLLRR